RRPEVSPGKLLFTRPHNLNWLPRCLRQPRRLNGTFSAMLAAIAAAHVGHNDADLVRRNAKGLSQLIAHSKGALSTRPDRELVPVPLSYCGSRLEWCMRYVLNSVVLFQFHLSGSQCTIHRCAGMLRSPISCIRIVTQIFEQLFV